MMLDGQACRITFLMCALSPGFEEVSRLFGLEFIGRAGVCLRYVELCERLYQEYIIQVCSTAYACTCVLRNILKSRWLLYVRSDEIYNNKSSVRGRRTLFQ